MSTYKFKSVTGDQRTEMDFDSAATNRRLPAFTIIEEKSNLPVAVVKMVNGQFPIDLANEIAASICNLMNGSDPIPSDPEDCRISYARHEKGKPLNGFNVLLQGAGYHMFEKAIEVRTIEESESEHKPLYKEVSKIETKSLENHAGPGNQKPKMAESVDYNMAKL
jgi:hypothetical protein